ncbi:hypothetical protein CI610_03689 [invertebrate metagenome]|uniref:Uncharacterized protein n=1 Tax=invertebrate metagenome TaxID=1711999 RepID=A0A2H9T2E6_9ZZZZ
MNKEIWTLLEFYSLSNILEKQNLIDIFTEIVSGQTYVERYYTYAREWYINIMKLIFFLNVNKHRKLISKCTKFNMIYISAV